MRSRSRRALRSPRVSAACSTATARSPCTRVPPSRRGSRASPPRAHPRRSTRARTRSALSPRRACSATKSSHVSSRPASSAAGRSTSTRRRSASSMDAAQPRAAKDELRSEVTGGADATAFEPALCGPVAGAVYYPDELSGEPLVFIEAIGRAAEAAVRRCAQRRRGAPDRRKRRPDRPAGDERAGPSPPARSSSLRGLVAAARGRARPLAPGRRRQGYHLDYARTEGDPRVPLFLQEARVVVTPLPERCGSRARSSSAARPLPERSPHRSGPPRRARRVHGLEVRSVFTEWSGPAAVRARRPAAPRPAARVHQPCPCDRSRDARFYARARHGRPCRGPRRRHGAAGGHRAPRSRSVHRAALLRSLVPLDGPSSAAASVLRSRSLNFLTWRRISFFATGASMLDRIDDACSSLPIDAPGTGVISSSIELTPGWSDAVDAEHDRDPDLVLRRLRHRLVERDVELAASVRHGMS